MSKKFKVIISVLIAMLLLTVGGATVAMAQDEATPESPPEARGLLARVANILGISQEQLVAAFQQARQEMREECQATENCTPRQEKLNRFRERLVEKQQKWAEKRQKMVEKFIDKAEEKGIISPEEAAAIREWWENRPEAVDRWLPPGRIFSMSGGRGYITRGEASEIERFRDNKSDSGKSSGVYTSLQPYAVSR